MPANEDQLALQYPAPTPSLEGSVAEPGSAAHQTEAEPEIAAVGQPAAPAGEPDPSSPGGGAASEAAAGPPSDDAELALQYPAPAPSLEGSVAEPVDADAPAPSAEMTDALEMPRAGEMVAAAPIGDAAVAEAGDVTPEPSIEAAETEGDSLSLSERASGSVEAQDLSIRAAEAEADNLYVAGEAAPGTLVHVYANEELVGEALAGAEGTWLVEAEKDVPIGEIVIRADAVAAGAASPSAQAEAPFMRFPDGVVLEPLATATAEGGDLTASGHMPIPTYALIRRGDNLWRIARRKYGRGIRYEAIFEANSDRIRDPDLIYPGQVFIIPKRDTSWETATN
jgi:nucleoid-associated protein YgaU